MRRGVEGLLVPHVLNLGKQIGDDGAAFVCNVLHSKSEVLGKF
jgi:hypothetical protein